MTAGSDKLPEGFSLLVVSVVSLLDVSDLPLRKKKCRRFACCLDKTADGSAENGTNLLRVAFVQAALGTTLSISGDIGHEARRALAALLEYSDWSRSQSGDLTWGPFVLGYSLSIEPLVLMES